jgi:hypothetical protein
MSNWGYLRSWVFPIVGGEFEGPEIKGRVLPLGADWQLVQKDGLSLIDTRYGLETSDGALIYISTSGYRFGPPDVLAALARGENVDPQKYYFRVTVRLETGSAQYFWMNRTLAIGAGMRMANTVIFNAYRVT